MASAPFTSLVHPSSLPSADGDTTHPGATTEAVLLYLRFSYPIVLLVFFIIVFTIRSIANVSNSSHNASPPTHLTGPGGKPLPRTDPLHVTQFQRRRAQDDDVPPSQKLVFEWLSAGAALTFVGNAINIIAHALVERKEGWWCGQSVVIYVVGAFFVYSLFLISLLDSTPSPTRAHLLTWVFALLIEVVHIAASIHLYTHTHKEPNARKPKAPHFRDSMSEWEMIEIAVDFGRIVLLLALIGFYAIFITFRRNPPSEDSHYPGETTSLLGNGRAENGSAAYGSIPAGDAHAHHEGTPGWSRPTSIPSRSWWEYIKGYSVFFPYLWPSKDRRLQIVVIICFTLVVLQRVVNVLVPLQIGKMINELTDEYGRDDGRIRMPWHAIFVYILYRFLQGSNGLIGVIRASLWIPIGQYSFRELSVAAFEHVHSLSLDFHLGKKTGEVLSALGKGSSINTFLEQVTFQVVPMLVDLCVAIAYFLIVFDAYYALVVAVVTFWYVYLTIRMAQWRAEIRRQMVNADRDVDAVKNDSMVSYETVKYFNAEAYEFSRYREAVGRYQRAEYKVLFSLNLMNISQNVVFMLGLMVACFVAAYQVATRQRQVGDFVTLLTYMAQLQSPLNFFGTFYRMIQSAMINSERMLELFKEQPTVVDRPGAEELPSCQGDLRFDQVHFSYDVRKPALQGLSFHCAPGTTTAFVGESGGGKSTVFRLLFRFYNTTSGCIKIDGYDVEDITIESLRRHIGVVPQDTVLFNESVMYNLKYANPQATDEDVFAACRAASIHDKIMSFPEGYKTRVGERGLRLSGGEKQRVAIARTILKNPRVIMLDEATAALDTDTEQHIQEAFTTLAQGRTMLVIAHRLSTITRADQILVLHEGQVAERGTHEELLAKKGRYANMWRKQIEAQRAAEKAKVLNDKADRLRKESKDGNMDPVDTNSSASSSDDERDKRSKTANGSSAEPARGTS